jgi:hypothetical protein
LCLSASQKKNEADKNNVLGEMSNLAYRHPAVSMVSGIPSPKATPPVMETDGFLTPCASTAHHFLYAHGSSVIVLQHDDLDVVRQFEQHKDDVALISVDNASDRSGRLAVSYDKSQNAIVWDIATGDEITHIASHEHLRAASWMKNGNVAFGMKFEMFRSSI